MQSADFGFGDRPLNNSLHVSQGDLLLAEPFLSDPNFARTVVLVCEHREKEGSFGLVINKPSEISLEEVTSNMRSDSTLFMGGPVEQDTLHFIHMLPEVENSLPLKNGVYWGGDFEQMKLLHLQGKLTDKNSRFFIGYSGWGEHQLRGELEQDSWIISDFDLTQLFDIEPDRLWEAALNAMGGRYRLFANYPIDPRLN